MRFIILFTLITMGVCAVKRVSYKNYRVYEVIVKNDKQLEFVRSLHDKEYLDVWKEPNKFKPSFTLIVSPKFQIELEELFTKNAFEYKIIVQDVEKIIQKGLLHDGKTKTGISFDQYYRYDDIQRYLKEISEKYAPFVTFENYGKSYENRNLSLIRISIPDDGIKPTIFIDAGIHAREWIAPAQALYIIHQLLENRENQNLIENVDWVIVPLVNPDGYEYSHEVDRFWRKTRSKGESCDGVDPNRNFDFHWNGPGTSTDECSNIYSGPHPFSEPETLALSKVVQKFSNQTKLYLTIHSAAQCLLYPWGYTDELPSNAEELHNLGLDVERAISLINGRRYEVGSSVNVLLHASGSSRDWAAGVANIDLSYTVELPPGGDNGFDLPPEEILNVVTEIFEGVKVFQAYVVKKYKVNVFEK